MSKKEEQFTRLTTPATLHTREIGFVVAVDPDINPWVGSSSAPVLGTTYSNSPMHPKPNADVLDATGAAYGTYILTKIADSAGRWYYYYSKNKTAAAAELPFKDPDENMGNHYWPPILLKVDIARSRMRRAVNAGDAFYRGNVYTATPTWIPSADTGSLFVLREMLSPTRFTIPRWPTPLASAVNFPLPGQSGNFNFPECLHDDITVDQMVESEDIVATVGGAISGNLGIVGASSFPATNFKTWLPYYLYDRQTRIATGAYHRTQMEVVPPPLPRRVRS